MKAETYGEYTLAEFTNGCQANSCDTIEKWTQIAPRLRQRLQNDNEFLEIYKFAGRYACEKGKRNLEIDWALAIQEMFFKDCRFFDKWAQFLREKRDSGRLLVLPRDTWDQFFILVRETRGDMNNFVDDGSWPTLFDEFSLLFK